MSAEPYGLIVVAESGVQIFNSTFLSCGLLHEAEIEVLLPAYNSTVGASECEETASVAETAGECRKLHILVRLHMTDKSAQGSTAESFRLSQLSEKDIILFKGEDTFVHVHVVRSVPAVSVGYGYFLVEALGDNAAEMNIAQLRQYHSVDLVEGIGREGDITAPVEIIKYISQNTASLKTKRRRSAALFY